MFALSNLTKCTLHITKRIAYLKSIDVCMSRSLYGAPCYKKSCSATNISNIKNLLVERSVFQFSSIFLNAKNGHLRFSPNDKNTRSFHVSRAVNDKITSKPEEVRENILTIPNLLTTARLISSPVLGYLVLHQNFGLATVLFIIAGFTDLLDGLIARNYPSQRTAFGTALDPLADKVLISILMISLTLVDLLPVPLTALIVTRDVLLIAGVCHIRYQTLLPPKTVRRYFDMKLATAELHPSTISKANTAVQLLLVTTSLAAPVFDIVNHPYLVGLWYVTAATTFLSGVGYLYSFLVKNNHVQVVSKRLKS